MHAYALTADINAPINKGCASSTLAALRYSMVSSEPARKITGIDSRNENRAAASGFRPSINAAVMVIPDRDVPGIKAEESSVKLGGGPTVLIYDARMVPNLALRDFVIDTADELGIPVQLSYVLAGATDGAAIHLHKSGVPTVVLGVPSRHIHSHSSMIHRDDYDQAVRLLVALLMRLDEVTVTRFTE